MSPNLITGTFEFAAVYVTSKRLLTVSVTGQMDPFWLRPALVRDPHFVGGLKFNLQGIPDGIPPVGSKPVPIDVSTELPISLPQEWFNSKTVLILTGNGPNPNSVTINYAGLLPPSSDDESSPAKYGLQAETATDLSNNLKDLNIGDVLPPIKRWLPEGETLTITAAVPNKPTYPDIASVQLHFNPAYFDLVSSDYSNGNINWALKWAKFPAGAANPQLLEVETDTGIQFPPTEIGPPRKVSKIIQGYTVSAVVFGPGPAKTGNDTA